jgi:uncharacterized membrane protein
MDNTGTLTTDLWKIAVFFTLQYGLGRRGSFPYGLLMNFSLLKISSLVIISDIVQTAVLLNFFEFIRYRIPYLAKKKLATENIPDAPLPPPGSNNFYALRTKPLLHHNLPLTEMNPPPIKKKLAPFQCIKKLARSKKYRHLGLLLVSALPFGGGALTASIMAITLKLDKKKSFLLIIVGCIIGTFLFYLGFTGLGAIF